jgi:hypothetical protein
MLRKHALFLLLAICFCCKKNSCAQDHSSGFRTNAGIVLAFGTRFDRVGAFVKACYGSGDLQFNGDLRIYYNLRNLGPRLRYAEAAFSLGVVFGYGSRDTAHSGYLLTPVSNQTGRSNGLAYAHTMYFNRIGTFQHTGTIAIQVNRISFISENDILGHSFYDRFRTGAVLLQYLVSSKLELGLNCSMWTGQLEHRVRANDYPYRNGYMDTTGSKFANCSAGLLSLQANALLPYYNQEVQSNVGVDAEQVRNVLQNRIIHDLVFLPKKWRSERNAHMPMLDEKGNQYLYQPGQKIRKPETYINGFLNPSLFY